MFKKVMKKKSFVTRMIFILFYVFENLSRFIAPPATRFINYPSSSFSFKKTALEY